MSPSLCTCLCQLIGGKHDVRIYTNQAPLLIFINANITIKKCHFKVLHLVSEMSVNGNPSARIFFILKLIS